MDIKKSSGTNYIEPPSIFMPSKSIMYPLHSNLGELEDRAFNYFKSSGLSTNRIYIPIKWTPYHLNSNYGMDKEKMGMLIDYCKKIAINNKYFTVVQCAAGIPYKIPNCIVFGAGGEGDIPIPLTTLRHPFNNYKKEYVGSFIGRLRTHKIRSHMADKLKGKEMLFIDTEPEQGGSAKFSEIVEKSYFTLCPRGTGKTSFRLYEAMQLGSVPIYISDVHWLPFTDYVDWSKFCIVISPEEIEDLSERLKVIIDNGMYEEMRKEAIRVYEEYFCFNSMFKWISDILKKENNYSQ